MQKRRKVMQEVFEKIIKRFEEEAFVHAVNGQQFEADGYDNPQMLRLVVWGKFC